MKSVEIAPAKGKLGILLVGLGAVSTTTIAGVMAIRKGLASPIGSLTQMGHIRLGKRTEGRSPKIKEIVPLAELDNIVNANSQAGLKIMLSVAHAPAAYRSASSGLMPQDPATFQTLMQTMAARYKGKVQGYELWNEENLAREAGAANINPSTYLPLLKAGYTGTKAGDPAALTMLGALSPTGNTTAGVSTDDLEYLKALYALNNGEVKNYYDIWPLN